MIFIQGQFLTAINVNNPSGDCLIPLFGVLVSTWITGAVLGTMVAAGMFILKSLVNNTWSWGDFARSLLIGAITRAATGGLTGGMSATGFNGAVIIGSMNGAIAGGVDALFNGAEFLYRHVFYKKMDYINYLAFLTILLKWKEYLIVIF